MRHSGLISISLLTLFTFAACGPVIEGAGPGGPAQNQKPLRGEDGACIEIAIACPAGQVPVDSDGDGCAFECGIQVLDGGAHCGPVRVGCSDGQVASDADGDGCDDSCTGGIDGGSPGTEDDGGTHIDGGCGEEPVDGGIACPRIAVECADRSEPIDADGDGCALECSGESDAGVACPAVWVECPGGADPVDSNGDGCPLECQEIQP